MVTLNQSGRNAPMKLRSDFREALTICTVSTVNLEKSDLNHFAIINTKGGNRRLLHPVFHGGSGMNAGGAHKLKKKACASKNRETCFGCSHIKKFRVEFMTIFLNLL